MEQMQKQVLQVAKEIVVKFIEIGRISPSNFGEHFSAIYKDVNRAVMEANPDAGGEEDDKDTDAK
jgi:hypothetical protein